MTYFYFNQTSLLKYKKTSLFLFLLPKAGQSQKYSQVSLVGNPAEKLPISTLSQLCYNGEAGTKGSDDTALTIQERLKDLRVERSLSLGLSEMKRYPNADLADLRLRTCGKIGLVEKTEPTAGTERKQIGSFRSDNVHPYIILDWEEDNMKTICEIDFSALSAEEKIKFIYDLKNQLKASFQNLPFSVQLLAETLIFSRWWNSYKHMAPDEPIPEILGIAIELLWDFQEGKCAAETFSRFQKNLSDSATEVLTGDDYELNEDTESNAFWQKYFQQWDARSYDIFLSNLCTVLEEAVSQKITWEAVESVINRDIGDTIIDFFEIIDKKDSGRCCSSEMNRREKEIYNTPTFARVIALIQQDMCTALKNIPLPELRAQYRNEYLFSPEESVKISNYR